MAGVARPGLYAQVGVGSFCVMFGARHAIFPLDVNYYYYYYYHHLISPF